MRVFKHSENVAEQIAREMYNIETGMLHFDHVSPNIIAKPVLYPSIDRDGIKTTIKSVVGFIYLPNDVDLKDFIMTVEEQMEKFDVEHAHLAKHARLERRSGQFTAMKARNTMDLVQYTSPSLAGGTDKHYMRGYILDSDQIKLGKDIRNGRFTWFVYPSKVMIKNIEQFDNPRFPATTQFVSIIYDKLNHIAVPNGTKLESNITFQHFRVCKNLISFQPSQKEIEVDTSEETDEPVKEERILGAHMTEEERTACVDAKKCPECVKSFKTKGGLTRHMNLKNCERPKPAAPLVPGVPSTPVPVVLKPCPHCKRGFKTAGSLKTHMKKCRAATVATLSLAKTNIQKDNMEKFMNMSSDEKKKYLEKMGGHPEYMPQWNDVVYDENHSLALCRKRGAAFELIRYYGKWDIYREAFNTNTIPLKKIHYTIYSDNFHNIIINQTLAPKRIPVNRKQLYPRTESFSNEEICTCCYTPLYGDIYVIAGRNDEGYAVCATCMHYNPFAIGAGNTMLRISYPAIIDNIVNRTNFSELKKTIMKQSFDRNFTELGASGAAAFYLGYVPGNTKIEYIGWSGFLSDFINYMDSSNGFYRTGDMSVLSSIVERAKVFPVKLINA